MNNTTTLEILKAARALISTPDKWTKGALARDAGGVEALPHDRDAVCFCAYGACNRAAGGFSLARAAEVALNRATPYNNKCHAPYLNDAPTTTHTDVLALFDRAIAAEEAK